MSGNMIARDCLPEGDGLMRELHQENALLGLIEKDRQEEEHRAMDNEFYPELEILTAKAN